ncbi:MAG TPA: hypothetical protein VG722_03890 [Tepidisphaeraceae bacterium]|nr:hypothetical protein [Tepidisphaeraceae bacterium]
MQSPLDLTNIVSLIARYLHIICATLLVGGTLFYEMVVPIAIADLRPEAQLAIFGRARWVFRQIVWWSAALIILSGVVSAYRQHVIYVYGGHAVVRPEFDPGLDDGGPPTAAARPASWLVAHAAVGIIAVIIAILLTVGSSPPGHPIRWMRLNLVILMIVIFLGSATRQVRLNIEEQKPPVQVPIIFSGTQPSP